MLIAEGGAGKTMALVQLALAVANGGTWLGTFDVPKPGKVLVVLGEEDAEEVHRRIHRAARLDGVPTPPEGMIVTLPLTGIACPMSDAGEDAPFLVWMKKYVEETGPYALVAIDPVSRFAGADAEKDNAAGTRFCQALESLVPASGGASVLAAHHTNKQSRGSGASVEASSSRGASSLTDGVRWVSSIGVERIEDSALDTVVKFTVVKTNYSKKPPPLDLRYDDGGVLIPLDEAAREVADTAREAADPRVRREKKREEAKTTRDTEIDAAVITCVQANPGIGASDLRTNVKAMAGCGPDAADTAIARMIQAGRITRTEGKTKKHYLVEHPVTETHTSTTNGAADPAFDLMDMV
jgi:RecA-family ATPase